jgi:hypothetical protein
VPRRVDAAATTPAGALVAFDASAADLVGVTSLMCTPASGSRFAIGSTTVDCVARDAAGNAGHGTFVVHVAGAQEQLADLLGDVTGVGPGNSLAAKLSGGVACPSLQAFVLEVQAQSGKQVPAPQAASFIARARQIQAVAGC